MSVLNSTVNYFSKEHTKIAKGIAILLMLYHHLFVIPQRLGNNYISVLNFAGFDLENKIAVFAKLCVGIFLFLSGIGLFYSFKDEKSILKMYVRALKKLLHFMINYWIIAVVVFPIGLYQGFFKADFKTVLGIITGKYSAVMEWWFVCQYVVLLLLSPLFVGLVQKNNVYKKALLVLILALIYGIVRFGNGNLSSTYWGSFVFGYLNYISNKDCVYIFLLGILCARFNLFKFFVFKNKWFTVLINLSVLIAVITVRVILITDPASMVIDYLITPFFVFSVAAIFDLCKPVKKILSFCAAHSTNIWLTHTFWCYYLGQKIVLLPKYSTLIFIWLFVLSVASSFLINTVYSFITKNLFKTA